MTKNAVLFIGIEKLRANLQAVISSENDELRYQYTYPNNDRYQPVYAFIIETEEFVEYDVMTREQVWTDAYIENPNYVFLGYGYMIYTYLEKGTWEKPEKLEVSYDPTLCGFFKRSRG